MTRSDKSSFRLNGALYAWLDSDWSLLLNSFERSRVCLRVLLPFFNDSTELEDAISRTAIPLAFTPTGLSFSSLEVYVGGSFGFLLTEEYTNGGIVVSSAPRSVVQTCYDEAVFQYILLTTTSDSRAIIQFWPANRSLARSGGPSLCASTRNMVSSSPIRSFSKALRCILILPTLPLNSFQTSDRWTRASNR